jgi:beta-lactamase regulating signal transducer with metallopeptidase domain/Leucine-rich repeat (LRR) protein
MTLPSERILDLAWTQCWQVALLTVAVAAICALACRRRPHLAYLLWMLVVVKALTPPLLPSPTGIFSWALAERPVAPSPSSQTFDFAKIDPIEPAANIPEVRPIKNDGTRAAIPSELPAAQPSPIEHVTYGQILLAFWGTSIVILSGYTLARWLLLMRTLRTTRQPITDDLRNQFQAIARHLGMRRRPRLIVSSEPLGPAAFGWWPGTVILPQSLVATKTAAELAPILAHELVHLRRCDTLAGSLQLAAQLVWWFHPAVWWASRQARVERERACDEEVLATLSYPATDYARMLVEILAWRNQLPTALPWPAMRGREVTKRRLQHLLHGKPVFKARTPRVGWLILLLVGVIVLPGAGLQLRATPPTKSKANAPPITATAFAVDIPDPAQAPPEPTAEQQATIDKLKRLGFIISPFVDQQSRQKFVASFSMAFRPLSEPLPLANVPMLDQISVRARTDNDDLSAQLSALRNLQPETTLHVDLRVNDGDTFNRLADIPGLTRLMLTGVLPPLEPAGTPEGRTIRIGQLTNLQFLLCQQTGKTNVVEELAGLEKLSELLLAGNQSDEQLALLTALRSLERLSLYAQDQSDRPPLTLNWIERLDRLQRLDLAQPISDAALDSISRLPSLHRLMLALGAVSDIGLQHLTRLAHLEVLHIFDDSADTNVTFDGLKELGKLKQLKALRISSSRPGARFLVNDTVMEDWRDLNELRVLSIDAYHCDLTSRGAAVLTAFPQLRSLSLQGKTGVTDELPVLSTKLRELALSVPELTDRGMTNFGKLVELRELSLADAKKITDAGLHPLESLADLRSLSLQSANFLGPGVSALAKLPRLDELSLQNCRCGRESMRPLGQLPQLKTLELLGCRLSDEQVNLLSDLTTLRELDLSFNPITDAALPSLANLKELKSLWLNDTQTTEQGRKQLAKQLPNAAINTLNNRWSTFQAGDKLDEFLDD